MFIGVNSTVQYTPPSPENPVKKGVRDEEVDFLHADEHQISHKLISTL